MPACNFDPTTAPSQPLGMYHCPECGVMIMPGYPHPDVRRYSQRYKREDPYVDVTDHPEKWKDDDFFDYHFTEEDERRIAELAEKPEAQGDDDGEVPF